MLGLRNLSAPVHPNNPRCGLVRRKIKFEEQRGNSFSLQRSEMFIATSDLRGGATANGRKEKRLKMASTRRLACGFTAAQCGKGMPFVGGLRRSSTAFFNRRSSGSFQQLAYLQRSPGTRMKSNANPNQNGRANRSQRRLANFITLVEQIFSGHVEINAR